MRFLVALAAIGLALFVTVGGGPLSLLPTVNQGTIGEAAIASDPFGIAHVSAVTGQVATYSPLRYQQAQTAGASWNRWVLYWHEIETSSGNYDYAPQDATVNQDVANGFRYRVDAVLMGSPSWATTADATIASEVPPPPRVGQHSYGEASAQTIFAGPSPVTYPPRNLDQSVFADGTDSPGAGKAINPQNYWARFVNNAVNRYKDRIRTWEIWNEPDYLPSSASGWYGFWYGTADQYYRLLKVAYLAAKAADPSATILMGGMAYWPEIQQQQKAPLTFFKRILSLVAADPAGAANNRFFDATAWHWYNRSNQNFYKTRDVLAALSSYGMSAKPIWINETGMPAWNDPAKPPPGGNQAYFGSGTMTEQASFVMQSLAYTLAAGVQRAFAFQEYDDGNGETFGLVRNDSSVRPAYNAYQLATRYLTGTYSAGLTEQGAVSIVKAFTTTNNRVVLLWNNSPAATRVAVSARASSATILTQPTEANPAGSQQTIYPSAGQYTVSLPGATDNNGVSASDYIVGGLVTMLVETGISSPDPVAPAPTPPPSRTGLIANGSFEQDFSSWTLGGYLPAQIVQGSGGKYVVLGADFQTQPGLNGANSTLSQSIALPTSAPSLNLNFRFLLNTSQPTPSDLGNPYTYDKFEVLVVDAAGTRHELLSAWSGTSWWTDASYDLTRYAGQTITLTLNVWQSAATANYPTTVYLDDVSLWPYVAPLPARKNAS